MLGAITTKFGTQMYYDKFSSKQKLQVCKQQQKPQATKTCNYCLCVYLAYAVSSYNQTW